MTKPKKQKNITTYSPERIIPISHHLVPAHYAQYNPQTGEILNSITKTEFENKTREELLVIQDEANKLILAHAGKPLPPGKGQSNAKARELFREDELNIPPDWKQPYRLKEIIRTLAYDTLASYSERYAIAQALDFLGWNATYDSVNKCIQQAHGTRKTIKRAHYENVQRQGTYPNTPYIKTPKLLLSSCNSQKSSVIMDWEQKRVKLVVLIQDQWYYIEFIIPADILVIRDTFNKVARPTIQFSRETGELLFMFTFYENIEIPPKDTRSVVAFDLGKMEDNVFVVARVFSDGRISEAILPSVKTQRVWDKIRVLQAEKSFVGARMDRLWWNNHEDRDELWDQYDGITRKITRLKTLLAWLIAEDLNAVARPGEPVITERLSWLVGSGSWCFGEIIDGVRYKCSRAGREFSLVSAAYASRSCPVCGARVEPSSDRVLSCECGWCANRDLSACGVMGRRYFRFDRGYSRVVRVGRNVSARERARSRGVSRVDRSGGVLECSGVHCSGVSRHAVERGVLRERVWDGLWWWVRVLLLRVWLLECFVSVLGRHVAGVVSWFPKLACEQQSSSRAHGIGILRVPMNRFYQVSSREVSHDYDNSLPYHTVPSQPTR